MIKAEISKAALLVHGVASKSLAAEDVPVGLVVLVHVFLDSLSNLQKKQN